MSSLRATAAEFVPFLAGSTHNTTPPGALTAHGTTTHEQQQAGAVEQQQQQQQLDNEGCYEAGDEYEEYDEGYYDEEGNWVCYNADEEWYEGSTSSGQHTHSACYPHKYDEQQQGQQVEHVANEEPSWGDLTVRSADAVQLLHAWYPSQPLSLLTQLYAACNSSLRDTINILSEMEWEQQDTLRTPAACSSSSGASTAVGCSRRQQEFKLQEELFPALSPAATPAAVPAVAAVADATVPGAHDAAVRSLADDIAASLWSNTSSSPAPRSAAVHSSSSSSWATVASKAAAAAAAQGSSKTSSRSFSAQINSSVPARQPQVAAGSSSQHFGSKPGAAGNVPWVPTGEAVSQEYAAARAEASDYARVRNACFHQATIAYQAGDKALAKELSAKGKHAAQQMWAAHKRASQQIFSQRNAQLAASAMHTGSGAVIDLHGLHVKEVQAVLPKQLAALAAEKQQAVSVIVGTGHHTKGPPSARVGPAVESLLQGLGYSYRQPQPGLLRVQLR